MEERASVFAGQVRNPETKHSKKRFKRILAGWQLYVLIALPLIYLLVFAYYPMYGVQIAFKDFNMAAGIYGSDWNGLDNFIRFFTNYNFKSIMINTIFLSLYNLLAGFPFPIILAISLNYARNKFFKKTVQMVTYAPYFISTVVIVGMLLQLLSPRTGLISQFLGLFGVESPNLMGDPQLFSSIYVWSNVWQMTGFNSIMYIAALASIDPELHEAALVDGASIWKRIWHVDLPGIAPTAITLLILNIGSTLSLGFEKILLMQNSLNIRNSEVLTTYIYKVSLTAVIPDYSYGTAVGLFQSVVNMILLILANSICKRVNETSLW